LLQVTFQCKYPIQEKYYACLFFGLLKLVKKIDFLQIDIQSRTRVFTVVLSGLSSKLEIVACLSQLII